MRQVNIPPLFRAAMDFNGLLRTLEGAGRSAAGGYPHYDIDRSGENSFRVTLCVPGFQMDQLSISLEQGKLSSFGGQRHLTITGEDNVQREEGAVSLHRGIARGSFTRSFILADHVDVVGAKLANGLLVIDLLRAIPEAEKPRKVDIQAA